MFARFKSTTIKTALITNEYLKVSQTLQKQQTIKVKLNFIFHKIVFQQILFAGQRTSREEIDDVIVIDDVTMEAGSCELEECQIGTFR